MNIDRGEGQFNPSSGLSCYERGLTPLMLYIILLDPSYPVNFFFFGGGAHLSGLCADNAA